MLKKDILNRQEYVDKLIEIVNCLSEKKSSFCFSIDGKWGAGKTYILDMFEEQVEKLQSEETADNKFFLFNYNCWKYDYYEEPAIAIIAAMIDKLDTEEAIFGKEVDAFLNSSWGKAKKIIYQIAGDFSENKIGVNLVEIVKNINDDKDEKTKEKNKFDEMFSFRKTLNDTRKRLEELAKYKSILFIVDELDRCLPHYSIKVMERLHHLFDGISNIIVILSVDSHQLNYSIQQIYGKEVEAEKYLKKFIDFTLLLNNGILDEKFEDKYTDYISYFYDINENDIKFFKDLYFNLFNEIDIRTQEKLMAKAKLIHEVIFDNEKSNPALLCFEMMWIVLSYRKRDDDLLWVPEINKFTYSGLAEKIGVKLEKFLQETEKKVGDNIISKKGKTHLKNSLVDNTFWIFASLYHPINKGSCNRYFNEKYNDLEKEVEYAKKFESLAIIMK